MPQTINNMNVVWNDSGQTFSAIKMAVTDTASASGSLLMDLQVGGASRFSVSKAGVATVTSLTGVSGISSSIQNMISFSTNGYYSSRGNSLSFRGESNSQFSFSSGSDGLSNIDTILTRRAAANLRLGAADAAAPVAQTLSVQSVVAGTTNTAGANLTITGSQGTGTGAGGSIVFQVAPAGSSGTAQNALATALTIDSGRRINLANMGSSIDASIVAYDNGAGVRSGFYFPNGGADLGWTRANTAVWGVGFQRCSVSSASFFSWSSTSDPLGAQDVILARDAANTLALRNGANAQTFNVYNTFTDASNYERAVVRWSSNDLQIGVDVAGTGAANRQLHLVGGTSGQIRFYVGATLGWYVNSSGHFLAGTDNTYDIGATGAASRPRSVYIATLVECPYYSFNSRGGLISNANGVFQFRNAANNDFDRIQFGGTTSSFPALKRSTTVLQARLADDSAFASVQGKLTTDTAYAAGDPTTTGYLVVYDSTGTAYKIPAVAV